MRLIYYTRVFLGYVLIALLSKQALASDLDSKPFAEHQVILQVSDADASKYSTALDIANNLIKHYGSPDLIDIEVIAFGKGVGMLLEKQNVNASRIESLMDNGVRFYVCLNTIDTLYRKTGILPVLFPGVEGVQTGVVFMLDEINTGYTHIHP